MELLVLLVIVIFCIGFLQSRDEKAQQRRLEDAHADVRNSVANGKIVFEKAFENALWWKFGKQHAFFNEQKSLGLKDIRGATFTRVRVNGVVTQAKIILRAKEKTLELSIPAHDVEQVFVYLKAQHPHISVR